MRRSKTPCFCIIGHREHYGETWGYFEMGKLVLPKIISDGMVIQRRKRIHVWGWDEPGTKIEVRLDNLMAVGQTDEKGRFDIFLSAKESGGPYELIVSDDRDEEIAV